MLILILLVLLDLLFPPCSLCPLLFIPSAVALISPDLCLANWMDLVVGGFGA